MPPSLKKTIRIHLLGAFRIEAKAQSIRLPTRKIDSLLAYLTLYPEAHTREKLATLFWGDSSEEKALGSLRKSLTFLRKSVADEVIVADRETVQLNPSFPIWVDVIEFERQARKFLIDPSPDPTCLNLDLYQGDLLPELDEDWVLPLREHYHSLYIDVLLRLVERSRAQSEYETAIEYANQILASDPANERAHQHLMFCHITLGERNKALLQYEACQRALRDELAVEPSHATQTLYNWIKQSGSELSSLAARLTNLPIPISSFVGRNKELAKVKQLLSNARLVTITGAGGSGKTRLAIHAATDLIDSFKDGAWWVELASITDPLLVPSAVAKALGVEGRSDQPLMDSLRKFLHHKQILIVLDNCEHLIDACAHLAESLLTSCAELKILATSRETLDLFGEIVWQVPTLSLPDVKNITLMDLLMQYEGIRLFVERAAAVNPGFTPNDEMAVTIAQVCRRLDGIPLAIELAAARIKTMSITEISERLDDRFQLLTVGNRTVQSRHQTLRATVDWSYDLLSDDERLLFCRLSVFSGGWTLDAAESVCSGEGIERSAILNLLARLVDKSLVIITDGQRYGMLETMRQYGDEKLVEAGCQDRAVQQYLDYYLKMANVGDEKIRGPEQMEWLKWFEVERDNLSGAMETAFGSQRTIETGCELVCALCWYWGMAGDFILMKHWLEIALPRSAELGRTPTRARVLFNAGSQSVWGLNMLEAVDAYDAVDASLELWSALGTEYLHETGKCLFTLGWIQKMYFDKNQGYDNFQKGIKILESTGQTWWLAWGLNIYELMIIDQMSRSALIEKEVAMWEKIGDQIGQAIALISLGIFALEQGDFSEANGCLTKSLQIFTKFGSKGYILQVLMHLGDAARGSNQYVQAEENYRKSIPLAQETMLDGWMSIAYSGLGYVALHHGDDGQAEAYFNQALKISREHKMQDRMIFCIAGFASIAAVRNRPVIAARLFGAFHALIKAWQAGTKLKRMVVKPADQLEIDEYLARCRAQIEPSVFNRAWEAGKYLSFDVIQDEISQGLKERIG